MVKWPTDGWGVAYIYHQTIWFPAMPAFVPANMLLRIMFWFNQDHAYLTLPLEELTLERWLGRTGKKPIRHLVIWAYNGPRSYFLETPLALVMLIVPSLNPAPKQDASRHAPHGAPCHAWQHGAPRGAQQHSTPFNTPGHTQKHGAPCNAPRQVQQHGAPHDAPHQLLLLQRLLLMRWKRKEEKTIFILETLMLLNQRLLRMRWLRKKGETLLSNLSDCAKRDSRKLGRTFFEFHFVLVDMGCMNVQFLVPTFSAN